MLSFYSLMDFRFLGNYSWMVINGRLSHYQLDKESNNSTSMLLALIDSRFHGNDGGGILIKVKLISVCEDTYRGGRVLFGLWGQLPRRLKQTKADKKAETNQRQ